MVQGGASTHLTDASCTMRSRVGPIHTAVIERVSPATLRLAAGSAPSGSCTVAAPLASVVAVALPLACFGGGREGGRAVGSTKEGAGVHSTVHNEQCSNGGHAAAAAAAAAAAGAVALATLLTWGVLQERSRGALATEEPR